MASKQAKSKEKNGHPMQKLGGNSCVNEEAKNWVTLQKNINSKERKYSCFLFLCKKCIFNT